MENTVFAVEAANLPDFVQVITDNDLDNEIIGQSDEGHYFVSIDYEDDDQEAIGELLELAEIADEDELEELEIEDED